MAGKVANSICGSYQHQLGLTAKCFEVGNFSYVCREAVNGKYKSLHAVIEMVEPVLTIDVGISRPTEVVLQSLSRCISGRGLQTT